MEENKKPYEISATKKLIKNALITKYLQEKNLEMLEKTLEDFPLVNDSLRLMLDGGVFQYENNIADIFRIVTANINKWFADTPDVAAFGATHFQIKYYFRKSDIENTKRIISEVKDKGIKPEYMGIFYHSLLMMAQPQNDMDTVVECADFFERHNVTESMIDRENGNAFEGEVPDEEYLVF